MSHEPFDEPGRPWPADEQEGSPQLPAFLLDPVGVLRRRWIWMLATSLAGLAATGVAVALWKPVYTARATVVISSQQIPEDFIRSTVREDSITNIAAMIGKVISQENLGRILDQFDLYPESQESQTRLALISRTRSRILIEPAMKRPDRKATALVYGVSFEDEDPKRAAEIANALAALFVESSMARRNEQAQRATQFLKQELERDDRDLRDHTKRLSEFRREHRGVLPTELETNLRKRDLLGEERKSLQTAIAEKESRITGLSSHPEDMVLSENQVMLEELRRQLANQSAAHTDEHPNVVALRRRLDMQEQLVAQERSSGGSGTSEIERQIQEKTRELERLGVRLTETATEMAALSERIDRTPAVGEELTALEHKEAILREDYLGSLRKVEEAELAETLESAEQGARVSVLDPAQPPSVPSVPRSLVFVGGLAASVFVALGMAVLLELVDPVVVSASQLEALSGSSLLGSLPRIT